MPTAATILITFPLGVLALVGLVYLLAPQHLPYHRTIIVKLGEQALTRKLTELQMMCLVGTAVIITTVMYSTPGEESLHNLLDQGQLKGSTLIFLAVIAGVPALLPSRHGYALWARRGAGMALLAFICMQEALLFTGYRSGGLLAGALTSVLLVYVTLATRALGKRTGAKTPWPLLAGLCVPLIAGTAIAFFA